VVYVVANMEPASVWQAQTDSFLRATNATRCGNDYVGNVKFGVRNLFAPPNSTNSDPRPLFLAINGLSNSPSHRQWEVLISDFSNGGGAFDFTTDVNRWRRILDSVQAPPPTLTNAPVSGGAGEFVFTFPGQRGRTNMVERSADLATWATVTNVFGTNAPITVRDTNVLNNDRRFYRVRRL
jgi:hypothetical protein